MFFFTQAPDVRRYTVKYLLQKARMLYYPVNTLQYWSAVHLRLSGVIRRKGKMKLLVFCFFLHFCYSLSLFICRLISFNPLNNNKLLPHSLIKDLYLFVDDSGLLWFPFIYSTIWRKERSGLEYRGSRWSQRVQCPHLQLDSGTFSIQINNVTEDVVGLYSCKVDLRNQVIEKQVMLRLIKGKKH